jgi:ELWxxDGT repeat protein
MRRHFRFAAVLLVCLATTPLFAGVPYQAFDLRTVLDGYGSSTPLYAGAVNGAAIFTAYRDQARALWRTDGTEGGTRPLVTMRPSDTAGGTLFGFAVSGNAAYIGVDSIDGWIVWKTDGTEAGTVAVTAPTEDPLEPVAMIGGRLVLLRKNGREIWTLDDGALRLIASPGAGSQPPLAPTYTATPTAAYIATAAGLWRTDGTETGTVRLTSNRCWKPTVAGSRIFFAASSGDARGELWTTNGTASGTALVTDLTPNGDTFTPASTALTALGDRVLFLGANGELGVSDATAGGTRILRKGPLTPGGPAFAVLGGVAYFNFYDGVHQTELWRSDGTDSGTWLVRDASPEPTRFWSITAGATKIYYYVDDSVGSELYESDGTEAGTHPVVQPTPARWLGSRFSYRTLAVAGKSLFFSAADEWYGAEPWVVDDAGPRMIANLQRDVAGSASPDDLHADGNLLYFTARGDTVKGIWRSDGTLAGTLPVFVTTGVLPDIRAVHGETVFFTQTNDPTLRKTNGPPGSETVVGDGIVAGDLQVLNGRVYVNSNGNVWTLSPSNTKLTNLQRDAVSSMFSLAGQVFFLTKGHTLYATDGTPQTTRSVARCTDDRIGSAPTLFRGAVLLFDVNDNKVCRMSGAPGDATMTAWPRVPDGSSAILGEKLLFAASDPATYAAELWASDGTPEGTVKIASFQSFALTSQPLFSLGSKVLFVASDHVQGQQLWVSDGTAAGTRVLANITEPREFLVADGVAYFSAEDATRVRRLWQSDGTPEGTYAIGEGNSAPRPLNPRLFVRAGDVLYFSGGSRDTGTELWAYALPETIRAAAGDARASESAKTIAIPVTLSRASTRPVTVRYETADDTAKAGRDYTAASGSLTFAPGETSKAVSVTIADTREVGLTRAFLLRLVAADVPIAQNAGAGVIEDADSGVTDLALEWDAARRFVTVRNNGPAAASNVELCVTSPGEGLSCDAPFDLASGATHIAVVSSTASRLFMARVTMWQHDRVPSNDTLSVVSDSTFFISPDVLRAGENGTILVPHPRQEVRLTLTSSNPAVVAVQEAFNDSYTSELAVVPFRALAPGTAVLTVSSYDGFSRATAAFTIHVLAASEPFRGLSALQVSAPSVVAFGTPSTIAVQVTGLSFDGTRPTGSVTFYEDGNAFATVPLAGGVAATPYTSSHAVGTSGTITISYSGDGRFFESAATTVVPVVQAIVELTAARATGATDVVVTVHGVSGFPPSGTVRVSENGILRGEVTLTAASGGASTAVITNVSPAARAVLLEYSGDARYRAAAATASLGPKGRTRAVRH